MLSIIVPRYATSERIAHEADANLERLHAVTEPPRQLIVVDNGSAHPLRAPADTAVRWPTNRGIAPAWNEGRRHAHGDVLAFVTTSTRVEPGWDTALAAVARSGRLIAMPYTNGAKPYGLGVTGWCWAIATALADEIGPFDETFVPAQYEDTDFFHRAIDHGVELVNVPAARVSHRSRAHTIDDRRYQWLHLANRFRYAWKHGVDPNDVPPFWKAPLRDV